MKKGEIYSYTLFDFTAKPTSKVYWWIVEDPKAERAMLEVTYHTPTNSKEK